MFKLQFPYRDSHILADSHVEPGPWTGRLQQSHGRWKRPDWASCLVFPDRVGFMVQG